MSAFYTSYKQTLRKNKSSFFHYYVVLSIPTINELFFCSNYCNTLILNKLKSTSFIYRIYNIYDALNI